MAYNVPSKYQPIWNAIKQNKTATIVAPQILRRRIIKAVIKRKDIDIAYKFLCAEKHYKAKLLYKIEGNTIQFTLITQSYLNSLGAY